ncbi:MAG: polyprenyl synthetase family protein [Acidobacteria bacterium]|nr:polyprenyl synthetase family protein [Acidobacteriota bacterium]MCA1651132.1 polyprenyl synthetase family protein [Acidobacteriota bacterium]
MEPQVRIALPRVLPVQPARAPQANIPQTLVEREQLKAAARAYVARVSPVPPVPADDLRRHAEQLLARTGVPDMYREYAAVLISNEMWRDALAGIPYERRLLLMPKCLRVESKCPAPFDEFGLLCKKCGLCSIQDLQEEAERLGYAVLVAEGSAIVMSIIETGKIEAIVGVSCLSVLERAFPYMEAAAIPGVAIPLLQDDCIDTAVDVDWVWDVIHLTSDDRTYRMDLESIRREVDGWFLPAQLETFLGPAESDTERIARDWLSRAGKRWRPFLTVCAWRALTEDPNAPVPAGLRRAAIAVECFHKASLVHDDIEDDDPTRYGVDALHTEHGTPVALNVGDLLIGEGYRLLTECGAPSAETVAMLHAAAQGHRTLALGQGAELAWTRHPKALSSLQVLEIFRQKTAPAFEVALAIGALYAGVSEDVSAALAKYSEALGVAYQIRDDIEDLAGKNGDVCGARPSLPLAVGLERGRAHDEHAAVLASAWRRQATSHEQRSAVLDALAALKVEDRCEALLQGYKEQAIRSLAEIEHSSLKGLLRRVVGKIFNDLEVKGWCSEFEARNAAGREGRADVAG